MLVAAREFARPIPPRALVVDVDRGIERHVDATFERFRRALLDSATTLVEPSTSDPDRARARVTLLVETLVGFAIGNVLGHAANAARRRMPETRHAIDAALARASSRRHQGATLSLDSIVAPPWLSQTAAERRPLLERLVSHLHARLCLAGAAVRTMLATIGEACGDRVRFASVLQLDTDTPVLAFVDQLELGWRFFTAVTGGAPDPAIDDGPRWRRSRMLWPAWSRRVRGVHDVLRVVDIDDGHILRIH